MHPNILGRRAIAKNMDIILIFVAIERTNTIISKSLTSSFRICEEPMFGDQLEEKMNTLWSWKLPDLIPTLILRFP